MSFSQPTFWLLGLLAMATTAAHAQHEGHQMPADATRRPAVDHSQHQMPRMASSDTSRAGMSHAGMGHQGLNHGGPMSHAYSRKLPMSRNGSGTAWNPDNTPIFMWMSHHGQWMVMNHGAIYLRYTNQNVGRDAGQRGGSALSAPN
jgi:hypothetical protein